MTTREQSRRGPHRMLTMPQYRSSNSPGAAHQELTLIERVAAFANFNVPERVVPQKRIRVIGAQNLSVD